MRLAIISDVHGNLTAFEAVLADLKQTSPDVVLHGGDLAQGGPRPCEVVDRIRDLGWPGVVGNTDEMLFRPESLNEFAARAPKLAPLLAAIEEMGASARQALGDERLEWLRALPQLHNHGPVALVHAAPGDLWRSPMPDATDDELWEVYGPLQRPIGVYGHIHVPYVRAVGRITVANSGSVGFPYDGDQRASYLLVDGGSATIRRVAYDVERELAVLAQSGMPRAGWVRRILESARPQSL